VTTSRALEALNSDGAYQHIHGIVVDGIEPVGAFLANLKEPDLGQFLAAFDKLDESGHLQTNPWKQMGNWFKPLHHANNVWQISSNTHRLLGFRHGHVLILTNGFYKTGGETPPKHIEKSLLLRKRYETGSQRRRDGHSG
jgi:hypothetical protein